MSPESNPARGLSETAGDTAGLYALGGLMGSTAIVGGGFVAINASFATPANSLFLWSGLESSSLAVLRSAGSLFDTTLGGRFTLALAQRLPSFAGGLFERGSIYLAANASGTVRFGIEAGGQVGRIGRIELGVLSRNSNVTGMIPKVIRPVAGGQ